MKQVRTFELGNHIKEQIHYKAVQSTESSIHYLVTLNFPHQRTSELNYIITFYDIIITSRLGFSKEADLFKDLSLYV